MSAPQIIGIDQFQEMEDLAAAFDMDARFRFGVSIHNWEEFLRVRDALSSERVAVGDSFADADRIAEKIKPGAALDRLQITGTATVGKEIVEGYVKAAATKDGLDDAPEIKLPDGSTLKDTNTYVGVWWPGEERGSMVFRTPFNRMVKIPFYKGVTKDEHIRFVLALVGRNFRALSPLVAFPCPECGTVFMPKRRGQFYHSRLCAAKVGERRRYLEERERLRVDGLS